MRRLVIKKKVIRNNSKKRSEREIQKNQTRYLKRLFFGSIQDDEHEF